MNSQLHKYIQVLSLAGGWFKELGGDESHKEALNAVSILSSWASLEAFIALVFNVMRSAKGLQEYELALLDERELKLGENGDFCSHRAYVATSRKILFLIKKCGGSVGDFKETKLWGKLKTAEDYRNELVHPKSNIDSKSYSYKKAEFVRSTVIEVIQFLNKKTLKIKSLSYWN